jgi:hypothetical protein
VRGVVDQTRNKKMGPKLEDLLLLVLLLGTTCVTSIASMTASNSSIIIAFAANEG